MMRPFGMGSIAQGDSRVGRQRQRLWMARHLGPALQLAAERVKYVPSEEMQQGVLEVRATLSVVHLVEVGGGAKTVNSAL